MSGTTNEEARNVRLVITASSLGTAIEWYDFYVYATLAALFGKLFFPSGAEATGFLLALATFGVGFAVRPLGGALFGAIGDIVGRKYCFLVTISLMGVATAAMGLLPTYAQIGIAAPILLVLLRALQGLAVGGEYGGAAIYVAEHAPANRRGAYTGWIQIGATSGFMLSLLVVLIVSTMLGQEAWEAWGWRIPFLISLVLLALSLWVRVKLSESPVFQAMKEAGEVARNPLRETFNSRAKLIRLLAVTVGLAAGQSIVGYTAMIQILNFMQVTLHIDATVVRLVMIATLIVSALSSLYFAALSDRVGRRKLVLGAFVLFLGMVFPLFHFIAGQANPQLSRAMADHPVVVAGDDCRYNPFAQNGQSTACGKVLALLAKTGVPYAKVDAPAGSAPAVTVGGVAVDTAQPAALDTALQAAGYDRQPVHPNGPAIALILLAILPLSILTGMSYGPVASWLVELFPARVRYTSLAIPYNLGVGYFAGFMPFIVEYIVARTGDIYAGLWYPAVMVGLAFVVVWAILPETSGRELD